MKLGGRIFVDGVGGGVFMEGVEGGEGVETVEVVELVESGVAVADCIVKMGRRVDSGS